MKTLAKNLLKKMGFEIRKFPKGSLLLRRNSLNHFKINKILDIGAATGLYAKELREIGFKGEIISFEPLDGAFAILYKRAQKDPLWKIKNYALGNFNGSSTINVASNSDSSSILKMLESHKKAAPEANYVDTQQIIVKKLDDVWKDFCKEDDKVFIKIDVQGFEEQVLEGAKKSLEKIKGIQIELSLIPLYKGSWLYQEAISFLESLGFTLWSLELDFDDRPKGRQLQLDGIFYKI